MTHSNNIISIHLIGAVNACVVELSNITSPMNLVYFVVFTVQTGRQYKSNIHNIWCFSISVILLKFKMYTVLLFLRLLHPTPILRSSCALR